MIKEIWKSVKHHEKHYKVSNFGRVKSLNRTIIRIDGVKLKYKSKVLKNGTNPKGYIIVNLSKRGLRYSNTMHRLVLETFTHKSKLHINHINGNIKDNRLENLEYVTNLENMNHRYTILKKTKKYGVCWDKSRNCWRSNIQVRGKMKHLGRFKNKDKAHEAFYNAYKENHGIAPW